MNLSGSDFKENVGSSISTKERFHLTGSRNGIPSSRSSYLNLNKNFINSSQEIANKLKTRINFELNKTQSFENDKYTILKETNRQKKVGKKHEVFSWTMKELIVDRQNLKDYDLSSSSESSHSISNMKRRIQYLSYPISLSYYKFFFDQKLLRRENFVPLYDTHPTSKNLKENDYSNLMKYLKSKQKKDFKLKKNSKKQHALSNKGKTSKRTKNSKIDSK
jgi:hypothetical protein